MPLGDVAIRDATPADIPDITAIYRHAVLNTVATLDTDEPTVESQTEWFHHHDSQYPVIVAVRNHEVVGWASLSKWSAKKGYRTTAEGSVYVSPDQRNRGIGSMLLQALISRARSAGLHVIVARISTSNQTSIRLVMRHGFVSVGTMKEVGIKFGDYVDVEVLQLLLDETRA